MQSDNLIQQWKRRSPRSKSENQEIMKRLKRREGKALDQLADQVHQQVFTQINCLDCAGCCTGIPPIVTKADASRIAKSFGMKPAAFEKEYLTTDEDGDTVMNATPCPFLLENRHCMIYDIRPKACRQYPHTDELDFSKNMRLHALNAEVCPAVYHIIRRLDAAGR